MWCNKGMTVVLNYLKNTILGDRARFLGFSILSAFIFITLQGQSAFAQEDINVIAENMVTSTAQLPGLLAALAYTMGLVAGVFGILKLKAHVENPSQAPLPQALIRLAVGGALFALPILYEAAMNTFMPAGTATTIGLQDNLEKISSGGFAAGGGGANELNTLANNVVDSTNLLPGLVAAIAYLLGILLAVTGLLKFKEAVDVVSNQPTVARQAVRTGIIRILIAGALFALPIIYEALDVTISGGNEELDIDNENIVGGMSGLLGAVAGLGITFDFNNILANIIDASEELPALVSAVAYLLGLVLTVVGLLKLRDHVEAPEQTKLTEAVVRLLAAGALFSLPSIYNAMFTTFGAGGLGVMGFITSLATAASFFFSSYAQGVCIPGAAAAGAVVNAANGAANAIGFGNILPGQGVSTGELLCDVIIRAGFFPAFLTAMAYMAGLVLGVWGILKLRDHVLNPSQTRLWEGISRLAAGGLFFALPVAIEVAKNTIVPGGLTAVSTVAAVSGYNTTAAMGPDQCAQTAAAGMGGLDSIFGCFMGDMMVPMHTVLNFFAFCAGMIFIMIGISRLLKSSQDGARGPGGLGTIMTFVMGAALMSYNSILAAASSTLFAVPITATDATLSYTVGMGGDEVAAAHTVVSSIIQFMIVVGLISFVRGLFIVRKVAEGDQQASIMAGMTHIIGGAAAVNLGPLINAVQQTLGIGGLGVVFS